MLLYDSFTIALRYSVKLPFNQFTRGAAATHAMFVNVLDDFLLARINSTF